MKQGIFLLNHFFLEKHIDLGSELPLFTTGTRPLLLTVPHTRVCTYANVCMCTYILTHKHTHTHAHTHTHTHTHKHTQTKTYTHTHTHKLGARFLLDHSPCSI